MRFSVLALPLGSCGAVGCCAAPVSGARGRGDLSAREPVIDHTGACTGRSADGSRALRRRVEPDGGRPSSRRSWLHVQLVVAAQCGIPRFHLKSHIYSIYLYSNGPNYSLSFPNVLGWLVLGWTNLGPESPFLWTLSAPPSPGNCSWSPLAHIRF